MYRLLLFVLLTIGMFFRAAAHPHPEDSLAAALSTAPDEKRVRLLNALSEEYRVRIPAKALAYAREAHALATRLHDYPGIGAALNNLGEYYLNNGNHDKALECFGQALALGKTLDSKPIVAVSTAHIAVVHYFRGQYDTSMRFAQEALPLLRELNLQKEWAENLSIISYLYNAKGNTQKALDYSLQALRLRQQMRDNTEIAKSLNSIGDFYLKGNNLPKAMYNYRQSLQASEQIDSRRGVAFSMSNIGQVYLRQGDYRQALAYFGNALRINQELGNPYQTATSYANLGAAHAGLGQYVPARQAYGEALCLFDRLENRQHYCRVLNQVGYTYSRQGAYREALARHQEALCIATRQAGEFGPVLPEINKAIADTYLAMNQPVAFARYYRQYDSLQKAHERLENKNKIAEMQAQFEEEENEKKLQQVNQQRKLQAAQLSRQRTIGYFLIACIGMSVGFSVVLFRFYRHKQQSNKQLQEQNIIITQQYEELNQAHCRLNTLNEKLLASETELRRSNETKDKFFSIIAHDLRSPLATFTAFLSVLSDKDQDFTPEQIIHVATRTEKSLRNLSALLNNLLQWSQSQMGHTRYDPEAVWLHDAVQQTAGLLGDEAAQKGIQLAATVGQDLFAFADRNMFSFVLRNLVSNAVKFTPAGGTICVTGAHQGEKLLVTVSDTGVGIPEESREKLFRLNSSFTTPGTQNERGTGLGLLLCKEFVERNGGSIWVESRVGEGSHFKFTVPRYLA
jgi:signal transduction histidine kinase